MPKKILLILSILAIVSLAGYFGATKFFSSSEEKAPQVNSASIENDSGCCMDPPCQECFDKLGYCDCDKNEKNGQGMCDECSASDHCEKADVCPIQIN